MEVSILSMETVRPSKLPTKLPLKLNLLDQLTPTSYTTFVLFYPNNNNKNNTSVISNALKWSLSETLSLFYPSAGRVRDNFAIRDFHEGVPFMETRVEGSLLDCLAEQATFDDRLVGTLNSFLPVQGFSRAPDAGPQVTAQLNLFSCGGFALGVGFSHKTHDGAAGIAFLNTWAAFNANCGLQKKLGHGPDPSFWEGPLTFPPVESVPRRYLDMTERLWFRKEGRPVTRRFVFERESIARLRAAARSQAVGNPTRAEALLAFLWKSIIRCRVEYSESGEKNYSSMLTQSVNLRSLTRPRLSRYSFGNLVLFSNATYCSGSSGRGDDHPRLDDLARRVRNGVAEIDTEYVERMSGEKGSEAIFEYYDMQEETEDGNAEVFNFSCCHGFGYSSADFGWGPAVWLGLGSAQTGGDGAATVPYCSNSVFILESGCDRNVLEVWMTLEESLMTVLENDSEFLEFASPRFAILPLLSAQ